MTPAALPTYQECFERTAMFFFASLKMGVHAILQVPIRRARVLLGTP